MVAPLPLFAYVDLQMDLASYIDHTLLKPEATPLDIERLCSEAARFKFAAVCVNPAFVALAASALKGSGVAVASVAGFPLGATTSGIKAREAKEAISDGAEEIDMVMAVGLFKGGDRGAAARDIAEVVRAAEGHAVKVIIETGLLTAREIADASLLAADSGAAFVKTSTGFGPRGATVEDIRIMREAVCGRARIKASGGIRTRQQAMEMIAAGASRIGTSAGIAMIAELGR